MIRIDRRILQPLGRMSWVMNVAVLLLLATGVLFVYSACYISDNQPVRSLYKRQILWAFIGGGCYLACTMIDYRSFRKVAWWGYGACVALLFIVLFIGGGPAQTHRWLSLFGPRGPNLQPSEFAKLGVILLLARRLSLPGETYRYGPPVLGVLALVALPVLLIMAQPDLGTALVFLPVTAVMMFAARVPLRTIGVLILIGLLCVGIVLGVVLLPEKAGWSEEAQVKALHAIGLKEYHKNRIMVFFNADRDPLGAGWNRQQSMIAVGSGGAWGKGFRKGTQNILGFLPRSVAPTDFVYSVIAEEMGFAGSVAVLFLYAVLMAVGLHAAFRCRDKMGRLLCAGIMGLVFSHVFINIAMTVGLMPITGLPLPLLSYGGSLMVVMMSGLGVVQSIYVRSRHVPVVYEQEHLWRSTPAVG